MIKRTLDIILSLTSITILLPFFIIIGIIIRLDSNGPVIYKQIRTGKDGNLFKVYKLRTMVSEKSRDHIFTTPSDDPRITKIGGILRKFNLDELTQFVNVLKGEMSIVGPRPEIPQYTSLYSKEEKEILSLKPGITDLATLWIKDKGDIVLGSDDPEKIYIEEIRPEKIRLQLEYLHSQSLFLDVTIMIKTIKVHFIDRIINKDRKTN